MIVAEAMVDEVARFVGNTLVIIYARIIIRYFSTLKIAFGLQSGAATKRL